jgi:hypothetical protein
MEVYKGCRHCSFVFPVLHLTAYYHYTCGCQTASLIGNPTTSTPVLSPVFKPFAIAAKSVY